MNTSRESVSDQDPDYVSSVPQNASQRKIYEENGTTILIRNETRKTSLYTLFQLDILPLER